MDWNLKASSWDLGELERDAIPNIDEFDSSSSSADQRSRGNFSIDLKLGGLSNSNDESVTKWKQPGVLNMDSSPSGSAKRARAANNGAQAVACLVDGCKSDLSNCRDYHRRHKVCELHSKTPQVTINGQKQRFCQQCSRFHALEEFDEEKRSCRKRLDGHNRRRRKPQPDALSRPASFLSNYQGTQLLSFSTSHVYPSTNVVNSSWSRIFNAEANAGQFNQPQQMHLHDKQNPFVASSPSSYKGGKRFPFLQGDSTILNDQTPSEASVSQPLVRSIALSESSGSSHAIFCNKLTTQQLVRGSDCALSLLSSTQTQTSENHIVQPNSVPMVQPLVPRLHHDGLESMDSVLVSSGSDADVHCPGMFHIQPAASPASKAPQTLPFNWE